ncbi:site-specific DNA-methyltransferase [Cloacibacterium normanense]|jgi:adenine-specific DNA-methyltransferase|uniref:site-specific DNA-methyltransferase (adenine-specific) n=1 Tax=Cloacibacterium normanense TaxID=237258 RepID=A0A1E5UHE2_9FLAO|nr:site-specific DNA-methyltransferase [Cloacibacterium normanense]AZI69442.1 site-specific DNA-methyltransferase [Cloacibacterium normanense]OEL12301.1 DNA methylase family protein [Cloacibacterium normanense]SDO20587.1 adenine-specific DNA-methyltransferase [Cloacibacterium normanense]
MSLEKITQGAEQTKSLDLVNENIQKLKELFPEVLAEGKIDFKVLQEILGEEIEEGEEYYRFTWAGKAQARREAHKPSTGTLRPCKEESVDWDTTQNLYIEGDNLEVLKLMQKSYANKVKMIYIDPPYNTGNDFVYKDDYKDNLKNYQEITGQIDSEGNKLATNSDSDGRYHSNWLNMMYPRLRLARNLLKEDGVIFISIDDNEVENLKKVCHEIFGEENFLECLIWKKRATPPNDRNIGRIHEFILCYCKDINSKKLGLLPRDEKSIDRYSNPDNDSRGPWVASDLSANGKGGRIVQSCIYPIKNPSSGIEYYPSEGRCWLFNREKMDEFITQGRIGFRENTGAPYLKRYLNEVRQGLTLPTILTEFGFSSTSASEADKIFEKKGIFEYAKPTTLLEPLLRIGVPQNNEIILDFFSGSGTTAQAILQLNNEDFGRRKFIMVQIPEPTDSKSEAYKTGYKTLTAIGKERIRRAGKKIAEVNPDKVKDLDLGFKVFKLDSSNIKGWDGNPEDLETSLFEAQENIKADRTEEDVLFEILLKYGLDLTLPIEEKVMEGKKVFNVGFGALFICLADGITNKVAEGIGAWKQELNPATCRVIFKDSGFTDVEKANAVQTLKRFGINEVKSI